MIKKVVLTLILMVLLSAPVFATNADGFVLVKSNIDSKIKVDLETQITNTDSGDVFLTTLLAKYDYDGKIKLPYGNYKITFIKIPDIINAEFEINYGDSFTISEDEPRVDISIVDTKKEPEIGALKLRINTPNGFTDDIDITISGTDYLFDRSSDYQKVIDLPVGEYRIEEVSIDKNKYELNYNSFIFIENNKDTDSVVTINNIPIEEPKEPIEEPEEPTTPIDPEPKPEQPEEPEEPIEEPEEPTTPIEPEPDEIDDPEELPVKKKSPLINILMIVIGTGGTIGIISFVIKKLYEKLSNY